MLIPALLGSRNYTTLVICRFCVTLSLQVQAVSVGWLVYQLTHTPLQLGLLGLTEAVPALALALFAGVIVDAYSPKSVYRLAILVSLTSAVILWRVSLSALALWIKLGLIYGATFLTGLARSFLSPSSFALLAKTLPRDRLAQASAMNSSLTQGAALLGPSCGGFLCAFGGHPLSFGVVGALLSVALLTLQALHLHSPPALQASVQLEEEVGILAGARFILQNPVLLAAMSLDLLAVLFGGMSALYPVFANEIFGRGPVALGLLRAAQPVGSIAMGIFLSRRHRTGLTGRHLIGAFFAYGICTVAFAYCPYFELSLCILMCSGLCDSISVITRQTLLQLSTPAALRGRVGSVSLMFIGSSNEIGAFESGIAANYLGLRPSVLGGGLVSMAFVVLIARLSPALLAMKLDELSPQKTK